MVHRGSHVLIACGSHQGHGAVVATLEKKLFDRKKKKKKKIVEVLPPEVHISKIPRSKKKNSHAYAGTRCGTDVADRRSDDQTAKGSGRLHVGKPWKL